MRATDKSDSSSLIAQNLSSLFSYCSQELNNKREVINSINSILRDELVVESFSLIKDTGTVLIIFERIPLWLSVLSPLYSYIV